MIASCGEAVRDLLPDGSVHLGGSPFNVARGLARLGVPSAFLGALPGGPAAEPFLSALREAGGSLAFVQRVAQPLLDAAVEETAGALSYRFAPEDSADLHLVTPQLAGVTALHVGSLALARLPVAAVVEAAAEVFPGALSLDPNARPTLISDPSAWRSRLRRIAARADLVKLSTEDSVALSPGRAPAALAAELLALGVGAVVLTDGAAGCRLFLRAGSLALSAVPVEVVDAVGAGDSFMAGLLCALALAGWLTRGALRAAAPGELEPALGFALAAAAASCARSGPYAPTRAEVEALIAGQR